MLVIKHLINDCVYNDVSSVHTPQMSKLLSSMNNLRAMAFNEIEALLGNNTCVC
jgi:hypothetical protein